MTRLVWILAMFCMTATAIGQQQALEITVHANPQLVWLTSDDSDVINNGVLLHINTGVEFNIFFMPNYAVTVGLELNNQGGKLLYQDSINFAQTDGSLPIPGGSELKHNLQYLGIPLGLKLKSAEMGYITFFVHGGLLPLFNLRSVTSADELSLIRENIKPNIQLFSMNYFLGTGIEYRLAGNTALMFGIKWSAGFNDVTENDFTHNNLQAFALNLGVVF